jgi:hypothetical protein
MTPIQYFMIIISVLTLIEIVFILSYIIESKQNQKRLKKLASEEDENTQEHIREVVREEFSYLSSKLTDIYVASNNINLGVTALANNLENEPEHKYEQEK